MDFSHLLMGRRLANREAVSEKVTAIEGVPAMGLDGLASSAYGPEAALTILIPAGALGLQVITPVMAAILVLLAMLCPFALHLFPAYQSRAHARASGRFSARGPKAPTPPAGQAG